MEHSAQYEILKRRYQQGRITESMLHKYVETGRITQEEFDEIVQSN